MTQKQAVPMILAQAERLGLSDVSVEYIPAYGVRERKPGWKVWFRLASGKLRAVGKNGMTLEYVSRNFAELAKEWM